MTVGSLITELENLDPNTEIVLKPTNSMYVESFDYEIERKEIRAFWGEDREAYVIMSGGQVGAV